MKTLIAIFAVTLLSFSGFSQARKYFETAEQNVERGEFSREMTFTAHGYDMAEMTAIKNHVTKGSPVRGEIVDFKNGIYLLKVIIPNSYKTKEVFGLLAEKSVPTVIIGEKKRNLKTMFPERFGTK